jgi:hypothetical protein
MRKFGLLLILLLVTLVSATEFEQLMEGDSLIEEDWNITVIRIFEDQSALLNVFLDEDKVTSRRIALNETQTFDGVNITNTAVFHDINPDGRILTIETSVLWKHECDIDNDCSDSNNCSINLCNGYPRKCDYDDSTVNITNCMHGDGCCPGKCTYRTDSDCSEYPCLDDSFCDDNNASTNDTCSNNETCKFLPITMCRTGDTICPNNCTYTLKLVANRDQDCSKNSKCISHTDCDDGNISTIDLCSAEPSTDPKNCTYSLNNTKTILDKIDNTSIKDSEVQYNDPPKATQKYIAEVVEKMPFIKSPIFVGILAIFVVAYLVFVFFKFKPKPEHI